MKYVAVTVAGTAVGILGDGTGGTISAAMVQEFGAMAEARVLVQGATIRFVADGSTPTASVGEPAQHGDVIKLHGMAEITGFQAIREGSVSATLHVHVGRKC